MLTDTLAVISKLIEGRNVRISSKARLDFLLVFTSGYFVVDFDHRLFFHVLLEVGSGKINRACSDRFLLAFIKAVLNFSADGTGAASHCLDGIIWVASVPFLETERGLLASLEEVETEAIETVTAVVGSVSTSFVFCNAEEVCFLADFGVNCRQKQGRRQCRKRKFHSCVL
jgi:hypothetical protein